MLSEKLKNREFFTDDKSQEMLECVQRLKQLCAEQECGMCVFADDNDGHCQLCEVVPCDLDLEAMYDCATELM